MLVNTMKLIFFTTIALSLFLNKQVYSSIDKVDSKWVSLFNGKNLSNWVNVNTDESTWYVENEMIRCTGKPTGLLRTNKIYENFILECEWRHNTENGNAGIFVWSDPLPAPGVPFSRSIEVQVMLGTETKDYTSEGDIFSIWGATLTPTNPHPSGWNRSLPTEARTKGVGEWNHYRIVCNNGKIQLAVNGKIVSSGFDCNPRSGYICLESEGSSVDFRNIKIKEINSYTSPYATIANNATNFKPLFNGLNFKNWVLPKGQNKNWSVKGTNILHNGEGGDLWSKDSFENFELICDWRWVGEHQGIKKRWIILPDGTYAIENKSGERKTINIEERDSGIYLRGSSKSQVNIWSWPVGSGEVWGYRTDSSLDPDIRASVTPRIKADNPIGKWNRFFIQMKNEELTVLLNGKTIISDAKLKGIPKKGPIGLQSHGSPIEFTNILIREIK